MRRPLIALALLLVPLFAADAARADDAGARCEGRVIEQPFLAWDDPADYFLAPDGDFSEGGAGWDLGGAEVVAENAPWWVQDILGTPAALHVASGAAVTSPTICVAEDDPTMRFFARGEGALQVEVLYTDTEGVEQALPIGVIDGSSEWTPSPALPITANTYEMTVAFRFTALSGDWLVDDVYVDPYRKGRAD
jgi:hypothetical protein